MSRLFRHTNWFRQHKPWIIFAFAVLFIIAFCILHVYFMKEQPWSMDKRGQFGDMFGALGAVFSGLAFAGLIVTLIQQHDDLKLQREDLRLQRQEIAQTNLELALQRKEMEEQNKTIMLQRFENTFFNMLEMQQKIVSELKYSNSNKQEYQGREAIQYMYLDIKNRSIIYHNSDIDHSLNNYYYFVDIGKMDHYFRHLYRIIKYVDEYEPELLSKQLKYNYLCILRAQLSKDELLMLFYNCLSEYGEECFKPLIEKYALLDNIRKDALINPEHEFEYDYSAYEFEKIQE